MGKELLLQSQIREKTGSKTAKKMRKQGLIPAVIYGHKEEPVVISLNAHDFGEAIHHGRRLLDIQVGKKKETLMIKDIQYDHLGKNVIHADFIRVDVTETVRLEIPVEFKGKVSVSHENGIIEEHTNRLEVECKVTNIPESIVVSVKDMKIGDTLHASDVVLPEGVKLISEPTTLLVTCSIVTEVKTTEEVEEEIIAPEVITEAKEEPESGEESEKEKK